MNLDAKKLLQLSGANSGLSLLTRGIEKESLRISLDGRLAKTRHPQALGSALTHKNITTDFSEAQLELITGVHASPEACLAELDRVHTYIHKNIGDEHLWPSSMPCIFPSEHESIPLGQYGSSNIGQAKTVYRRGLGHRYGRLMQTISGIHYNFSLPDELWNALGVHDQEQRTDAYFGLIRNFRRWSWLLIYLFGASPAVCRSFIQNLDHRLDPFNEGTYYLPYATSLRMGRLGYQSDAQSEMHVSYNSLDAYSKSMREGLTKTHSEYAQFQPTADGEYQQLNDSILQIENEFYGTIRPKRTARSGERPLAALNNWGVEYVEVRCIDLNPFEPQGINLEQIRFIDTFLLLCLLADSPEDSREETARMDRNQAAVVEKGREPNLALERGAKTITLSNWANELLTQCQPISELLDTAHNSKGYGQSLSKQLRKVESAQQTPSAKILASLSMLGSFSKFSLQQAGKHHEHFLNTKLSEEEAQALTTEAEESLKRQADIEANESVPFGEFLKEYIKLT